MVISNERIRQLFYDQTAILTEAERASGWHWCPEWDFLPLQSPDPSKPCDYCRWLYVPSQGVPL